MTQFWLTNFCSSPFWHLKFLQPPIPLWETGEERERKKTGEGRGCSITLFCSTTKPPFSPVNLAHPLGKRKSQKGLHRIARNRDTEIKKKQKQKTGEEREKKTGEERSCHFCCNSKCHCFWVLLITLSFESPCAGEATTLGGADVGETLPYHQHHPILSSS